METFAFEEHSILEKKKQVMVDAFSPEIY